MDEFKKYLSQHRKTLDADIPDAGVWKKIQARTREKKAPVFIQPKSQQEIQQAYEEYLRSAEAGEQGRRAAMSRLARMELDKVKAIEKIPHGSSYW